MRLLFFCALRGDLTCKRYAEMVSCMRSIMLFFQLFDRWRAM